MKTRAVLLIFMVVFVLFGCGQKTQNVSQLSNNLETSKATDSILETVVVDLNQDNILDTISLVNPPVKGDPGQFQKVTFSIAGLPKASFHAKDVWDIVDASFLRKNKNLVTSNRLFVFRGIDQTLVLLFGFLYGSGRDEFSVIQIKGKQVGMIYDKQMDEPVELVNGGTDGSASFVGRDKGESIIADDVEQTTESYSPYHVYSISGNGFSLNDSLSKTYNEEHYVWAGMDYNEGIKVFCPKDGGKPKVIK